MGFQVAYENGSAGIVIVGTGNGNLSDRLLRAPATLGDKTLLVRRPRTGSGSFFRDASYDADTRY